MRSKYSSIVSIFCAIVYVASIGIALARISASISERKALAAEEFRHLVDRTSSAAVLGFMDQPFREAVRDELEASNTLKALILSGPSGGEYAVEIGAGYISWESGSPRFVSRFGISGNPLFAPLRIEGIRNVTLSAVSEDIDKPLLGSILLNTLIAIFIALLIAAAMLWFDLAKDSQKRNRKTSKGSPIDTQDHPDEEETENPTHESAAPDFSSSAAQEEPFEIPAIDPDVLSGQPPPAEPSPAEPPPAEPSPSAPGFPAETDGPRGLYSPRGNISWEAYTKDRLSSELHRCASFEQDLVFMGIENNDPSIMDKLFIEFAAMATAFFTFRDLIFERGANGISIILPNIDLDHGFRMAEEFRHKIATRSSTPDFAKIDLRIGLSSRSGRLVDPDRLLAEADRALEKARDDPASPIVAFKSDPERYRRFLAAQA